MLPPTVLPFRPRPNRAMALVLTLMILVLILGMVLAFFSRASLQRQISSKSLANAQANLLASTATGVILGDLRCEIEAGSLSQDEVWEDAPVSVQFPILVDDEALGIKTAPSIEPQQRENGGPFNVLKISRSGVSFFDPAAPGYRNTGALVDRASEVSTSDPSANGRRIDKASARWNLPTLMTGAEYDELFEVPDWIYLDRSGATPRNFTSMAPLTDRAIDNDLYVIARFAYVIYQVGGLLDVNVVGNSLAAGDNRARGRLHQVLPPPSFGGSDLTDFANFVKWRWPDGGNNSDLLFEPTRTFIQAESGEQFLVNRQDLIRLAGLGNGMPASALPFFTTFSRSLNAPLYYPSPDRPMLPVAPPPEEMNPDLPMVRFDEDFLLQRPDGSVPIRRGNPVMPRRFPLAKLALLSDPGADADEILYYFGLKKQGEGRWRYVAKTGDGRIARLSEVAALRDREPNFFEILQAVMLTGSLGKSGGDTVTLDQARDSLQNFQVIQIGANIIDQWDGDDYPTTVEFPSADPAAPFLEAYGIENLPYISQMAMIPHRVEDDLDLLRLWLTFEVWNPHQNAPDLPQEIAEFRIKATSGSGRIRTEYNLSLSNGPDRGDRDEFANRITSAKAFVTDLNQGRNLTFLPAAFASPTLIGEGRALTVDTQTGILMGEQRRGPAVPRKEDRTEELQIDINALHDEVRPYSASNSYAVNSSGEREYPAGTTFTGLNTTHWTVEDRGATLVVYGNMGAKATNMVNFVRDVNDETVRVVLQWLPTGLAPETDGNWRTYQVVDDLFQGGTGAGTLSHQRDYVRRISGSVMSFTNELFQNTHHSVVPASSILRNFYPWRSNEARFETGSRTFNRSDPRTQRFGFASEDRDLLEVPARSLATGWGGSTSATNLNWLWLRNHRPGINGNSLGFQSFNATRYLPYGLASNNPDLPAGGMTAAHPTRYSDNDGVIRPGDAYYGSLPNLKLDPGTLSDRPVVLNRPFRSVGELGHAFRGMPWKTLDFFSGFSADAGLLDVFSLDESVESVPLVAGKIDLNSARPEVLAALLQGAYRSDGEELSAGEAAALAQAVVDAVAQAPLASVGDLVSRRVFDSVLGTGADGGNTVGNKRKAEREAAVRVLSEMGMTRTWNIMIDLIAQSGRFSPGATGASQFHVEGESRRWVHVAIDRITGEVLDIREEMVDE